MSRLLITGSSGQVGHALRHCVKPRDIETVACTRTDLDILDSDQIIKVFRKVSPDIVVNTAAYTAVDRAEEDAEAAFAANRDGAANLAKACAAVDAALIHLSTDYVFDGTAQRPYTEEDATSPIGVYGQSKLAGETAVRENLERHIILRLSWVFGEHGGNFVKTMFRLATTHPQLRIVADQHGCPTYTGHIAEAILQIASRLADKEPAWGTFHYRGSPETTWHGFANRIVESARLHANVTAEEILPVTTSEFPTPAARPAYSVLDCNKIEEVFGITPQPWSDGVDNVIAGLADPD